MRRILGIWGHESLKGDTFGDLWRPTGGCN